MEEKKIRVLIVDHQPVVRRGLRAILEDAGDMEIVAEASDGPSAVAAFARCLPDVTLTELRLPNLDGAEVIAAIRRDHPAANVIVLSSHDGDKDVVRAFQAGARGYLLKTTFPERIAEAIRSIHAGERLIAPEAAARLADWVSSVPLTVREIATLEQASKGLSNKEIGLALGLSNETVKTYLSRAYAKLGVSDRTEAVMLAVQRGILAVS